jgi:glycosyltransferase involved in cell wall biosynthesis
VMVNGSGVNLDYYSFKPPLTGVLVFLMIARLLKEKGISEYIEAAGIVKRKYPEARFKLIGWDLGDNHSSFTKKEQENWKTEGFVEIRGPLEDVRPFLEETSVYVLPSYREGTPRTVLEAMATGRAVITTDAPGCRETVVEGTNGFLVPVRDGKSLAVAMERFIKEPDLVERMGRESRRIAEEKYDVHKVNAVINRAMDLI